MRGSNVAKPSVKFQPESRPCRHISNTEIKPGVAINRPNWCIARRLQSSSKHWAYRKLKKWCQRRRKFNSKQPRCRLKRELWCYFSWKQPKPEWKQLRLEHSYRHEHNSDIDTRK